MDKFNNSINNYNHKFKNKFIEEENEEKETGKVKEKEENQIKDYDNELDKIEKVVIGLNESNQPIFIPKKSRYLNTLVLGTKGTGKTTGVLPTLLEQDFMNKDYGATVIVSKNETAYNLYALAKRYKRDVIILKPSINNEISNKFLWKSDYNYDYINENIINYKEVIKKRKIVIIDMEILKHKNDGLKAVAMLLLQLQLDMQETDVTQNKPHFLYIDDAHYYLSFLEFLLSYGDNYNIGITLFMKSRKQFIKNNKDYSSLIDSNIRNILLLNALEKQDISYYKDRLYEFKQLNLYYNRNIYEILYEIIDNTGKRKCGIANYSDINKIDWKTINSKAKTFRKKLLKNKRKELEKELLLSIKSKYENKEDDFYEEKDDLELNKEELDILNEAEQEIAETLTEDDFNDGVKKDNYEPTPIDLSLFDDNKKRDNNEYIKEDEVIKQHVEIVKKDLDVKNPNPKELEQKRKENIQKVIKIKEKGVKRIVSTKIFNKVNTDIHYCEDDFDFSFD